MADVVTDTHGLIWHLEDSPRLGTAARDAFDACDRGQIAVYVPTICLVEIIYLQEKGRIPAALKAQLDAEHLGLPLISRDRAIQLSGVETVW